MFYDCLNLKEIKEFFKLDNIKDISFLFYNCSNLKALPEKLNFKTINLKEVRAMFYKCKSLEKIPDMSTWNFNKVKNMSYMFFCCEKINNIPIPINDENFTKDKDMRYFDYNCNNLNNKKKSENFFLEIKKNKEELKIIKPKSSAQLIESCKIEIPENFALRPYNYV